jgi:hypothetical protein
MTFTKRDLKKIKREVDLGTSAEERLADRVEHIIRLIKAYFDAPYCTFWWDGAGEGEMGQTPREILDSTQGIIYATEDTYVASMETEEYDYNCSFPHKFLFMTDAEIKNTLA